MRDFLSCSKFFLFGAGGPYLRLSNNNVTLVTCRASPICSWGGGGAVYISGTEYRKLKFSM